MRNPDWVRDEIILAMDLYVRADRKQLPPGHEEVVKLSQLLNRLPLHPDSVRSGTFRNAAGISMILGNFLSIDPLCDQPGLSRSNQLQAVVWDDFIDDLPLLHRTAQTIQHVGSGVENEVDEEAAQAEESFREGHLLARLHIAVEPRITGQKHVYLRGKPRAVATGVVPALTRKKRAGIGRRVQCRISPVKVIGAIRGKQSEDPAAMGKHEHAAAVRKSQTPGRFPLLGKNFPQLLHQL